MFPKMAVFPAGKTVAGPLAPLGLKRLKDDQSRYRGWHGLHRGRAAAAFAVAAPQVQLQAITSRKEAGLPVADMYPSLRGHVDLAFVTPDAKLTECDVVFFATPHGVAMAQARELLAAGVKVIDLAADFRLQDTAVFEQWYGMPHSCPDILAEAVYGLPELNRRPSRRRASSATLAATPPPCNWVGPRCSKASWSNPPT